LGQQQRDAIDYLREENQVLREQLGAKRIRLNHDQRRLEYRFHVMLVDLCNDPLIYGED
jgi:hypothetical protein